MKQSRLNSKLCYGNKNIVCYSFYSEGIRILKLTGYR